MQTKERELLKLLGVGFGIAVTIGGTIGTGILRKPGPIASQIGDPSLILLLWLAVGIYAIAGVLCAIELAVALPKAGAWYVYAKRAFGGYFGFVTGITSWLGTVSALGFGAYTFSEYIAILLPSTDTWIQEMAIALLILLCGFHWMGTRTSGASQEILAFIKAVGLFLFVVVCFIYGQSSIPQTSEQIIASSVKPLTLVGIVGALQAIFYTYDGWHTATYFTEENKDPAKDIPRSMLWGVILIILIYLLVNGAILYVLPLESLAGSKLAAADAVSLLFGEGYSKIITLFLMISILGIVNAQIMFAPRVIYSMSRDGLFFAQASKVNAAGTPSFAMPVTAMLSVILILGGKGICSRLSDIATFFFVLSYAAGFAALIQLRRTEPDLPRPFRTPFVPALPVILIVVSLAFLIATIYSDPGSSLLAIGFMVISYPLFLLIQNKSQSAMHKE
jgi:APA family basic amino acid/polyamine antiporter